MSQYLKPQPERLKSKIKHIVVLMLENRSFDNLLGWLYEGQKVPNNQSFDGLNWNLWNPLNNVDADGNPFKEKVPVAQNGQVKKKYGKPVPNPVNFCLPDPDPGEGFADTTYQLFEEYKVGAQYPPAPINMGFVQNYNNAMLYGTYSFGDVPTDPRKIMTTYTPEQTPVLSELARSFAVCDQYFASVPSQTLPNRAFIHAGTSDGSVNNTPNAHCSSKTIYNQIQDAIDAGNDALSWKIYGNNIMSANKKDASGKFGDDHFSLTRVAMTRLHDEKFDNNFDTLDNFYVDCKKGSLPGYSFLEPNFGGPGQNDQHPPMDIRPGEKLIADIYNAVRNSPAFEETLLVITYDEHGGCYDHVPPPGGARNPDPENKPGQNGFLFNRFGVRVPCVLINPYIPKGLIARPDGYTPFDHTSVIKTVQNCFGLDPYLTERSNAAPDLSCVLTLDKPRKDFPDVRPLKWDSKVDPSEVNELHRLIAKMVGELSGKPQPKDEEMLNFIQENYNRILGKRKRSSATRKTANKTNTNNP